MARYFFDNLKGDDRNSGLGPDSPFKTLDKANAIQCRPDDALLFAAGGRWEGQLAPKGSGAPGAPCIVAPYGAGPRPRIDGCGRAEAAILLHNVEHWEVRGMEVTNEGPERAVRRIGIFAQLVDYGTARHIIIEDNYVHDVNGSNVKRDGEWNGGIFWKSDAGAEKPSRYIGVTVRNNRIERCDRVGIFCRGLGMRDNWFPMLDVLIYGNELHDIGGDGILNIGTDGCVVERNRLIRGRVRDDMYCAGIWPWSADNTIIKYNEVAGYVGTKDGQGYDCDFNCIGTIHIYNYSHDNDGGYMLVCTGRGKYVNLPKIMGTNGSRIIRNLSVNDLCRTFHIAGPVVGTLLSENCVYVGEGIDIPCILVGGSEKAESRAEDTLITRNVFAARGCLSYARTGERFEDGTYEHIDDPAIPGVVYMGNSYLGNHRAKPEDPVPSSSGGVTIEQLEELLLDKDGRAKPGLTTLDNYLKFMGWPKK
ncbi:MAG: right-handed parallel beta-helix repeat-containing protein [Oscillospiraceae bacterium]|nr:right-handed parallel beta-helix repeat-containing protein [Oscillospiraceae bacterium]